MLFRSISNYTLNHLRNKVTASLQHTIVDKLSLSWLFRWQDRAGSYIKYVDQKPAERTNYKPFAVVDAKANYPIGKWNLFINANNIFNTTYLDLGNFPQAGFWLMGGDEYKW